MQLKYVDTKEEIIAINKTTAAKTTGKAKKARIRK